MSRDAWDDSPTPDLDKLSLEENAAQKSFPIPIPIGIAPGAYPSQVTGDDIDKDSIDAALLGGLENPRERMNVLKFEDKILRFLQNRREQQLVFEPLSSYHRLIVHRLAQRFELEHQAVDMAYEGQQHLVPVNKGLMLSKTALSEIPKVLLIDLPPPETKASEQAPPKMKQKVLMRRRGNDTGSPSSIVNPKIQENPTILDREKAYQEARARIFGPQQNSNGLPSSTVKTGTKKPFKTVGKQAQGPDGSKGFGRGRGQPRDLGAGSDVFTPNPTLSAGLNGGFAPSRINGEEQSAAPLQPSEDLAAAGNDVDPQGEVRRSLKKQSVVNVADWKDCRVAWRDANADRQDDDFRRGLDKYQRSFAPYRVMEIPVSGAAASGGNMAGPPIPSQPQPTSGSALAQSHHHIAPAPVQVQLQGAGTAQFYYGYPPLPPQPQAQPQPQHQPHNVAPTQPLQMYTTNPAYPMSGTVYSGYGGFPGAPVPSSLGHTHGQGASLGSAHHSGAATLVPQPGSQPQQQPQYYVAPLPAGGRAPTPTGYQEDYQFAGYYQEHQPALQDYQQHDPQHYQSAPDDIIPQMQPSTVTTFVENSSYETDFPPLS